MSLGISYANGQLAALAALKLAFLTPNHPAVRNSSVNALKPGTPPAQFKQSPTAPIDPPTVVQNFNAREQEETRIEPRRKLSAEICTSCRKEKHYGPCKRPVAIPLKRADFNMRMHGGDPRTSDLPSTSANYSSATSAVSALAQAPEGRPADEQAATAFASLLRPARDLAMTDEPGQMTSALDKVSSFLRGQLRDDAGSDRIWREFDIVADSTSIDGGAGTPSGEPA